MPYSQLPPTILYPPIATDVWVVISRLSEKPVRVVPNLNSVNHASEFALPFPSGEIPTKVVDVSFDKQIIDDLARPIYDDDTMEGTSEDLDIDGEPLPPKMSNVSESRLVTLRDYPDQFTLQEIFQYVVRDFLKAFPFYNDGTLLVFDDRFDAVSLYQDKQHTSGFATGGHPIFMGPIQFRFDASSDPRGHLLLVAPEIKGINWFFQIRHGATGVNGQKGPIDDLQQASRQGEVFYLYPMANVPVTADMLTDSSNVEVTYGWIRTGENGLAIIQKPVPVIPFIVLLRRSTGSNSSLVTAVN